MKSYTQYSTWNGLVHGNSSKIVWQGASEPDGYVQWCAVYDMEKIEDRRFGYPELNSAETRFVVHSFWYLPDPYAYENGFLDSRYREGHWKYCDDLDSVFTTLNALGIPFDEFGPAHRYEFPM